MPQSMHEARCVRRTPGTLWVAKRPGAGSFMDPAARRRSLVIDDRLALRIAVSDGMNSFAVRPAAPCPCGTPCARERAGVLVAAIRAGAIGTGRWVAVS